MPRPPAKAQGISADLAARIVEGEFAPGAWLPSERELSERYAADRSTIRRALAQLTEQGLIALEKGVGAQVRASDAMKRDASDITRQVGQWRGFATSVLENGQEPFTHTTVEQIAADETLAHWLGVPVGARVLERARVQGVKGTDGAPDLPVQTATTYVTWRFVELVPRLLQVNTGPGGIYSRLEEIGHAVALYEETVTCRLPQDDERQTLEITSDQPVLTLWRRAFDQHGQIIEATHRVVVGDRHDLMYRFGPGAS